MKSNKTVVVGLSGGVDSSVAAMLLKKQGFNVIGAFMKNFSDNKNPITGECNWVEEKKMAQKVAAILEIKFVTFDFEKEYKKLVIDPMYKDYARGLTPNPDILCNTIIKFPLFWKHAQKLGADYIAMGHYVKVKNNKGYELIQGKDKNKDQSYFLYELSEEDLSHTLFPIGNYTKGQVREIAKKSKLPNWDKKGTRGICFVGKVNLKSFLKNKIKEKPGKVIDPEGNFLGTHPGTMYFTIGQRIGPHLGIEINKPDNKRWYIAEKKGNILVVAPQNHPFLKKRNIIIKKLHLINKNSKIPRKLKARIRHLGDLYPGRLKKQSSQYIFALNKPLEAIAEGQAIVFYNKDKVLGGGEIAGSR